MNIFFVKSQFDLAHQGIYGLYIISINVHKSTANINIYLSFYINEYT